MLLWYMEHIVEECAGCQWHESYCKEVLMSLHGYDFEKAWGKAWKEYERRCPAFKKGTKVNKGNGKHVGVWAGTFTCSPSDDMTKDDMVTAVKKLFKQKSCPLKRYVWYLEYTKNDLPHIHFMYETESGGRIERKHFKRVWRLWDEDTKCGAGHRGGYHRPCHSETEYLTYVKKDDSPDHEDCWELKPIE